MEALNYKRILIQLIITLGLMIGSYFYGVHKQFLEDDVLQKEQIILNQNKSISKLELSDKNNDNTISKLHKDLEEQNNKFNLIIEDLQNDKKELNNKLNSTNHINGLLVRTIQLGISGNSMPENTITSSGTHDITTTYKATELTSGIIDLSRQCNVIRTNYIALQEWNKRQVEIYNK